MMKMGKNKAPAPTCPSEGCGKKLIRCKVLQPRDPNYGRSYDICSRCQLRFWLDEEAFNVLRDVNTPPPPPASLPLPRGAPSRRGSMSRAQSVPPTQQPRTAFAPNHHPRDHGLPPALPRQPLNSLGRNHTAPSLAGGGRQRHSSAGAPGGRSGTPMGYPGARPPTPGSLPFGGSRSPTPSAHGGFGAFSPPPSNHGGTRSPTPSGSEYGGAGGGGYFASQPVTPTSSSHPSVMSRPGTPSGRSTPMTSSRASSVDRSGLDRSGIYDNEDDAAAAAEIYNEDGLAASIGSLPPPGGFEGADDAPLPEPQLTAEPGNIDDVPYEGAEEYPLGPEPGFEGDAGDFTPQPQHLDPAHSPNAQRPSPPRSVAMRSPTPSMRYPHHQQQYPQHGEFQSPGPGSMGMRSPTPSMMSPPPPMRGAPHSAGAGGFPGRPPPVPTGFRTPPSNQSFRGAPASAPAPRRSSISTIVAPRVAAAPTWQPGQNRARSLSTSQEGGGKRGGLGLGWFGQIRTASPGGPASTRSFTQPPPRQSYAKTWTAGNRAGSAQPAVVLGNGGTSKTAVAAGLARKMSVGAKSFRWGEQGELIKDTPSFGPGGKGDPGMMPPPPPPGGQYRGGPPPPGMPPGMPMDHPDAMYDQGGMPMGMPMGPEGYGPPPEGFEPGMEGYGEEGMMPMEGEMYDDGMAPLDGPEGEYPLEDFPPEGEEGPFEPLPA